VMAFFPVKSQTRAIFSMLFLKGSANFGKKFLFTKYDFNL
jgi:hypothetical protein